MWLCRGKKCFELAAAQGNADAKLSLGCLHQDKLGVEHVCAWAMECFEQAAAQGHAAAQSVHSDCKLCNCFSALSAAEEELQRQSEH